LHYEELEFETEDTVVEYGEVTSKVLMTLSPSARMVRVKCVAYNEVGYVEDTSEDYLTYNPDTVTLDGPSSVIAGEEAVFNCASENSFPAPSLMWTLDGQDVTRDAEQSDNQELLESGGGVSSLSKLKVNPTMGGHTHVVECFVAGTHLSKDFSFHVEDLYEEDTYEDTDAVFRDTYEEFEEEYEENTSNDLYEYEEYQQEGEYFDYTYNDHEKHNIYNEDSTGVGKDGSNITSNFNESQSEHDQTIRNDENEEDNYDYDEDQYDYTSDEYDDYDGKDYKNPGIEYNQDYDNDKEANFQNEKDSDDAVEEHNATEYNENIEHSKENIENEKGYDENDASEYKESKPVDEEIFDATQQQQSFAAAEPGSAVLSHESDPSTHVSADMFSPKPLYGSGERVWCGTALIFVTICNLLRMLR